MNEATITTDILCRFEDRQWMRAAKAWRCILTLPENQVLTAALTHLIDRKVKTTIIAPNGIHVTMDPVVILDVKTKGRFFQLILETCYESQKEHGPHLTAMHREMVRVTIDCSEEQERGLLPQAETRPGKIGKTELRGLHSVFFKNPRFQRYVELRAQARVSDEATCKTVFKDLHQIESCTELDMEIFKEFLQQFNKWIQTGGAA